MSAAYLRSLVPMQKKKVTLQMVKIISNIKYLNSIQKNRIPDRQIPKYQQIK
jgi:hypothetical protein